VQVEGRVITKAAAAANLRVDEGSALCIRFAREAGYVKLTLWTQSVLVTARHTYEGAGFRIVHHERHHSFGRDLIGEN